MAVIEDLLEQSLQLQREIKSIAVELRQLHSGLEQEMTEFCNIVDRGNEQDLKELTMNMSSFLSDATKTTNLNRDRKRYDRISNDDDRVYF